MPGNLTLPRLFLTKSVSCLKSISLKESKMSAEGFEAYVAATDELKEWFHRQWQIWPKRADERYTTNADFHYEAIQAHIEEFGSVPQISEELISYIKIYKRLNK